MTHGQSHATHVDLGDPQLNERIGAGMEAVEDKLRSEIDRGQDFLKDKSATCLRPVASAFAP